MTDPEVISWIKFYDDPEEMLEAADDGAESDLDGEPMVEERSSQYDAARNPEDGGGIQFEAMEVRAARASSSICSC